MVNANRYLRLLVVMSLIGLSAGAAEPVSQEERDALLAVREIQGLCVVTLNRAILAAQEADRARLYQTGKQANADTSKLRELDEQLQALQDRFFVLYQAHFGKTRDRKRKDVPLSEKASALAADSSRRQAERDALIAAYQTAHDKIAAQLKSQQAGLASIRGDNPLLTPPRALRDLPSATLQPDGTATGIIFGQSRYPPVPGDPLDIRPGMELLGIDYEGGVYERYDRDYKVSPVAAAKQMGRKAQIVIPCDVGGKTYVPEKWFQEQRNEPILSWPDAGGASWMKNLDIHHPLVREMLADVLPRLASKYKGNRDVLMNKTAWEPMRRGEGGGPWGHWPNGDRTDASLIRFRERLEQKFTTIDKLNDAWQSKYESFDAIEFPPDTIVGPQPQRSELIRQLARGRCPPLYYEFQRYYKDSYSDYLAWCYRLVKEADPTHPVAISVSHGSIDGFQSIGRDSFQWADVACDVYGMESTHSLDAVFDWSIHRALGRTLGTLECIWNEPENWSNPPEEVVRAAARRNLWRMIAWECRVITLYGPSDTYGGIAYNNLLVFDSGYHLLRRSAGIIAPLKRKLRSMEDVWLGVPIVEPKIAMLKPSTAQLCGWPIGGVEKITGKLHDLLYRHNYHYAFVPEEYLLDGKDDLNNYRVLVLPHATHFPPGLTDKILPWVDAGGTLIIAGIAGGFTPYGQADGRLMKQVFGEAIEYQPWGDYNWKITNTDRLYPRVRDVGPISGETFLTPYGKGQVLMAARAEDLRPGGPAADLSYDLLDIAAPRTAWAEGDELEMILRRDDKALHITLINPSTKKTARSTIHVAGQFASAVDRGIDGGFAVKLQPSNKGQAFDVTLAPGEGTLVSLNLMSK